MDSCEDKEKEKEEFMNYLDQHGILDKITETLIMLYNVTEQPSDPIDFVRTNMCSDNADVRGIAEMETMIANAEIELKQLLSERDELKIHLTRLEGKGCSSDEDCGVEPDDDLTLEQLTISATDPEPEWYYNILDICAITTIWQVSLDIKLLFLLKEQNAVSVPRSNEYNINKAWVWYIWYCGRVRLYLW